MTPFRKHLVMLFVLLSIAAAAGQARAAKPAAKPAATAPPAAVLKAFQQAYPKAVIKRTIHEQREGKPVVEIESVDHGILRDLLYTPEGKLLECEETIPADSLPAAVRTALKSEAPGAKVGRIERIDREGVVTYSINVTAKGKAREIAFDPSGKLIEP